MKSHWTYGLAAAALIAAVLVWWWQGREYHEDTHTVITAPERLPGSFYHRGRPSSNTADTQRWDELTDSSIRWQLRVDMLRKMEPKSLTPADEKKLLSLLSHRATTHPAEAWWVVLNEIMEQMRVHGIARDRYADALLSILGDNDSSEVPRDYAIQHLGQWIAPRDPSLPSERDAERAAKALDTIVNTITDSSNARTSVPGTALNTLTDIHRSLRARLAQAERDQPAELSATATNEPSQPYLNSLMEQLTQSLATLDPWLEEVIRTGSDASLSTRVSAISTVAELGRSQYRDLLREIVSTVEADPSMRLSAVAALGSMGASDDLPVLEKLSRQPGPFREAAKYAYKRLKQKTSRQP